LVVDERAPGKPAKKPSVTEDRGFHAAWLQQTPPFSEAVAIAPSGHVAVVATRSLSLHHPKTGAMLARKEVCTGAQFTFIDDKTGALVCEDGVRLLSVPDLEYRSMHAFADKARATSFAPGLAAVSFTGGVVRVFDASTWTEKRAVSVDDRVTALAVSKTQLAIGLERGEVLLYALEGNEARRIAVKSGLEVEALALSRDRLFASAGPMVATWRAGVLERRFDTVGAVTAARWIDDQRIAVIGRDGLLLLDAHNGAIGSIDGSGALGAGPAVGLAVSADSRLICAAERDGKLACFSRGRLPASRPLPIDLDPGAQYASVMAGRVHTHSGARLKVTALPHSSVPEAGTDVVLLRYTAQKVGPARWIRLAEGRVVKVEEATVSVRLDSELVPIEGVKDPLTQDTPLRLAWQRLSE
jgi:hypothetical protein